MYTPTITPTDIHSSSNRIKSYAGIGSRETPQPILTMMTHVATLCDHLILRSGGAPGADTAFELGAKQKQIFLPWVNFNGNSSPLYHTNPLAYELAATVHPTWTKLKDTVRLLISRNMHQVLGPNLDDPVAFVACYTPDGAEHEKECSKRTGGTGTAIILASRLEIPVFNLYWGDERTEDLLEFIRSL